MLRSVTAACTFLGETCLVTTDVLWWPPGAIAQENRVTVVTVSHNTKDLTALLLWSLHRVLDWRPLEIVVVDNGSSDGSLEVLTGVEDAGGCVLLANETNLHHGPALNQALSWLAARTEAVPEWVWVLDSDCVIARADVLTDALAASEGRRPAMIGEPIWDRWHQRELFGLYSLLMDPAVVWRPPVKPFTAGGDPATELLTSAEEAGLECAAFGFAAGGHVIHRGRGSLAALALSDDRSNPLFQWATEHNEAHFGGIVGARERYRVIVEAFRREVGAVTGSALGGVCTGGR